MTDIQTRFVKIDGWIFEIKAVRAIRAESYGQPYSAIANFNLQGETAYIDGLMTKTHDDFSRDDHRAFEKYFSELGLKKVTFERYCNQGFKTITKDIEQPVTEPPMLKLVR